jgi:hypothetical protein
MFTTRAGFSDNLVPTPMAFSAYKFFKGIRNACVPLTAGIAFSFLLTVIFVLYQPSLGPGERQKLGWQSWASVSPSNAQPNQTPSPAHDETAVGNIPDGTDWWDVVNTNQPAPTDSANLPLDEWDPLQPHDTGSECFFPLPTCD